MAWACTASSGTGSLVFIDDMTEDGSSRMNSEVYRNILSVHIQPNSTKLIGWHFTVQMDNDPKHTAKATQAFFKAMKWNILQWPSQLPDLNPIERAFHLLKTKAEDSQGLAKHHKGGYPTFGDVYGFQTSVIACKGFSTKY